MRVVVLIFIFFGVVFANSDIDIKNSIKEDLQRDIKGEFIELRKDMRENNRLLLEVIKANQESTNRRFEDINSKFNMILMVMISGFALILGYLIKERSSIKKDIKSDIEEELTKKADKNLVEDIIKILIKISKDKRDIEAILHKYHIV